MLPRVKKETLHGIAGSMQETAVVNRRHGGWMIKKMNHIDKENPELAALIVGYINNARAKDLSEDAVDIILSLGVCLYAALESQMEIDEMEA
jgi:hypothetical protein